MNTVAESSADAPAVSQPRVELHDGWLRLGFDSARSDRYADFHYRWLRHHGGSERHPLTAERTLCSADLPDDLQAVAAAVVGDALEVGYSDGSIGSYPLSWLFREGYAHARRAVPPPPSELAAVTLHPQAVDAAVAADIVAAAKRDGIVIVRRSRSRPADPSAETEPLIEALSQAGLQVACTHYGRIEDLRTDNTTNQNTDQLGYTDAGIELHTDQTFLEKPPRYQLLQSIRSADSGGENFLVDALAAARYLASSEEAEVELLRSVPIRFLRQQKAFASLVESPILQIDGPLSAPRSFQIRLSYFTVAPYQLPFSRMSAWYRAHDHFVRLCRDRRHQRRFTLEPGDFVLYDNHRMLHGRTAFAGPRWVRGIYLNPAA
jgi:gamma-butyrobetaine dioxygenase/trimethyllysine dioxygenase